MRLNNSANSDENWATVLRLWTSVYNWSSNGLAQQDLQEKLKTLTIYLWNEKDWLVKEFPARRSEIESYVDNSNNIKVVADLANEIKHRKLDRKPRSDARGTDYFGRVTINGIHSREMYYIDVGDGKIVEIFAVLNNAINEYEELHILLLK